MLITLHDVVKTAEAQRRFPNWVLWSLLAMALTLWAISAMTNILPWERTGSAPAVQPFDTTQGEPAQQVQEQAPPAGENPPVQTEPEEILPAAPVVVEWPLVQVEWTLVPDLSILPPAEEGFYNGTMQNRPYGASSTPEWAAYAGTIVPEFGNTAALVAAARDPNDKQVVLVGLELMYPARIEDHQILEDARGEAHLFLSVDGEGTWTEINLIPVSRPDAPPGWMMLFGSTRVIRQNGATHLFLYAGDGLIEGWWTAIVP